MLFAASLDGVLVRGPMLGSDHAYARVADWLPDAAGRCAAVAADRDRALAELARRYLAGHAPAGDRDLARWAGLPLRDARRGLDAIAAQLTQRPDGLMELAADTSAPPPPRSPAPRLLGAFEPLLMGWCSRTEILGNHDADVVSGGIFRGFALVRGRGAATWRFRGSGVAVEPFAELTAAETAALERDGRAVSRFLGREP